MVFLYFADIHLTGLPALLFVGALLLLFSAVVLLVLSPGIFLAAYARRKAGRYYASRSTSIVAQYDPPRGLSPAEVGLLYDMRCGAAEIWATLLDLAYRKIITLSPEGMVGIVDSSAFLKLPVHEQLAVRLHAANVLPAQVPFSAPPGQFMGSAAELSFPTAVQRSLAAKGLPTRNYTVSFGVRVLILAVLLGLWPLATAAMSGTYNGTAYRAWSGRAFTDAMGLSAVLGFFLWPVNVVAAYLVLQLWTRVAGRAWLNTRQIRALWPELEGYRLFLKEVEYTGYAASDTTPLVKSLPYAVVFGLKTDWQPPDQIG